MNTTTLSATEPSTGHAISSREAWTEARIALLKKEKEYTRLRDELNAERQALPWVRVEKTYEFDGPDGRETLADLFDGRSQLIIQHFMLGPGWDQGCVGCSFLADHIAGALVHLENHDVSLVVVSRAPLAEIEAFKKRMGWTFKWVSSFGTDFNYDYHVSFTPEEMQKGKGYYNFREEALEVDELHGHSAFYKNKDGEVFHTYSAYARGCEPLVGTYAYLDIAPLGRNEPLVDGNLTNWVRHHDRYDAPKSSCGCH